jgi:hypothetical protein
MYGDSCRCCISVKTHTISKIILSQLFGKWIEEFSNTEKGLETKAAIFH